MPHLINIRGASGRRSRPRDPKDPDWQPGKSAVRILQLLTEYRYLTTMLLGYAYTARYGRGTYQVRNELRKLWEHEYVEKFWRPTVTGYGSQQQVYVPTLKGAKAVLPKEHWPRFRKQIETRARQPLASFEHALAVVLLQVIWDAGKASQGSVFTEVAYWTDRAYGPKGIQSRFAVKLGGRRHPISPDTTALVYLARIDRYRPLYFEIERSHKNDERTRERFRAYAELVGEQADAAEDVFEKHLDIVPVAGQVVFLGGDAGHAERLRAAAADEFDVENASKGDIPNFWFLSLDDLIEQRYEGKIGSPKTRLRESIIDGEAFFTRELAVHITGKRGPLLV